MESEARTLQAEIAASHKRPARRPAIRRSTFRPRILLADDSEAVRLLMASLFRRMDCDVDAVEHGEAALGLARHARYHLILLDLDMPMMDGIAAAREIRRLPTNSGTPIMAVSAFLEGIGDSHERNRLFDAEIAKPVTSEKMRRLLLNVWPRTATSEPALEGGDHHLPLADRGILDAVVLRAGRQALIDAINTAIVEMRACAGSLDLAVARDEIEPLKRTAQKLNRIALSCGAARLARRATVLAMLPKDTPPRELRSATTQVLGCVAATVRELTEVVYQN